MTPLADEDVIQNIKALCGHSGCKRQSSYTLKVHCVNCGWAGTITLTQGHEFSKYSKPCRNCGCDSLTRN